MTAELILEPYQERIIEEASELLKKHKAIIVQSETGSGKTVIFSEITNRYLERNQRKRVIILVDRLELFNSTRSTLLKWHGIISQAINQDTEYIDPNAQVYVAMVETFDRRANKSKAFLEHFKDIGLVIIDEAHKGNFNKIFVHFIDAIRIGFTATPLASNKKEPLKDFYTEIVIGPTPQELLDINAINPKRGIIPAIEYSPKNVDRKSIKINSKGEFDEKDMGTKFSQHIQNTINAYLKYSYGRKTICFDSDIDHSIKMAEAFRAMGLNARHLNGSKSGKYAKYGNDKYREDCMRWLKETPDAILCNVGIATTGFDEPSIETVIINRAVMSITLFRQMRGRGGRPFEYADGTFMEYFVVIDMGDNVCGGNHGEWHETKPWRDWFFNPNMPKDGISPIKSCPECGSINFAGASQCQGLTYDWLEDADVLCGFKFPVKENDAKEVPIEIVQITSSIDVSKNIIAFADRDKYVAMFKTYEQIALHARKNIKSDYIDAEDFANIYDVAYKKINEWHKLTKVRKFNSFKSDVKTKLIKVLQDAGFIINIEEIEEFDMAQIK